MLIGIRNWGAWSPGLDTPEAWQRWSVEPAALETEGSPDLPFVPAMLRRRCSRLTKMMLRAAWDATEDEDRSAVRPVFASRHGAIHIAVKIIDAIYRGETVSPMQFSHSVHNAAVGTYSIATGNREASSSLAGGEDSFASGFLEAALLLDREPSRPVLFVMADEPVPPLFSEIVHEPVASYAVGLLLSASDDSPGRVRFELAPGLTNQGQHSAEGKYPDAAEFLRWWLTGDSEFQLNKRRRSWHWSRS